jgi:hypothetical protein
MRREPSVVAALKSMKAPETSITSQETARMIVIRINEFRRDLGNLAALMEVGG